MRSNLRNYSDRRNKYSMHFKIFYIKNSDILFSLTPLPRVSQKWPILPKWKIQLSPGIFELFGSKAFTKIFFENFRARLALHKCRRSFRGLLIKSKNKSAQTAPKMKSWGLYHTWGFQKCKNYQNIPTGSGSTGLQSKAKFGKSPLIRHGYPYLNGIWPTSGWNILIIFAFLESLYMI